MAINSIRWAVLNRHSGQDLSHPNWCALIMLAGVREPCMPPPQWAPRPGVRDFMQDLIAGKTLDVSASIDTSLTGAGPAKTLATGSQRQPAASQPETAATQPRPAATKPKSAASKLAAASLRGGDGAPQAAAEHSKGQPRTAPADALESTEAVHVSTNPFSGVACWQPSEAVSSLCACICH